MIKTATPLAKDNMGLAYAVVQRIGLDNGISIQDSEEFSDACIGLINAEMNYNPERAKFSTFAYTLHHSFEFDRFVEQLPSLSRLPFQGIFDDHSRDASRGRISHHIFL